MEGLIALAVIVAAVIVLPLLLLKLLLGLFFGLVMLPFKILGGLLRGVGALLGLGVKLIGVGFGLVFGLLVLVVTLVLLPLLPFLLMAGAVWLLVKVLQPPSAVRLP